MNLSRRLLPWLCTFLTLCLPALAQVPKESELVQAKLLANTTAITAGQPFNAGVHLRLKQGWHTYWQFPGDSGAPVSIAWKLPPGFKAGAIQWPLPKVHLDEGDLLTYIYEPEVLLLVEITPPAELAPGEVELAAQVEWLACEKSCIPGKSDVALKLPAGLGAAANTELFAQWRALIPKTAGAPFQVQWVRAKNQVELKVSGLPADFRAEFFPLPPEGATVGHPNSKAEGEMRTITLPVEGDGPTLPMAGVLVTRQGDAPPEGWHIAGSTAAAPVAIAKVAAVPASRGSLAGWIWKAFLGGLLLNIMPCVLPVIALKIFGFVKQAGEEPARVFRLGLAFVAGVFVFFFALAALVLVLKQTGREFNWALQFQDPYTLTILIGLVFVFALSMLGVFEIELSSGATSTMSELSSREGYSGAFVHGLFTTLLGTSCTAPLLAPALGFAVVQSPLIIFTIFGAIAAGMSLPYFLLTARPAWMRYLPKPGTWMVRFKQLMGFALLALAVWLYTILGGHGSEAMGQVGWFLLVLGLASWLIGTFERRLVGASVALALAVGGYFYFVSGKLDAAPGAESRSTAAVVKDGIPWVAFTPTRLDEAIKRGQPVFIDFTADWCLNCKYNERFVLETGPVRAALKDKQVLPLKADWTRKDPEIGQLLRTFGRIGVPAYVIYPGGAHEPVVLPEILTQQLLLEHLGQIKS